MAITIHVALNGSDANPGTTDAPLATLAGARDALRNQTGGGATVWVHEGTHYFEQTLTLEPRDSGTAQTPIVYQAAPGERVTLSGGRRLDCKWEPYRDGIMMCRLPQAISGKLDFTQLFVDGDRQVLARYPNKDDSDPEQYTGYIHAVGAIGDDAIDPVPDENADMTFSSGPPRGAIFDPQTFTHKQWDRPDEAVIHIYQGHYWGNMQWRIKHLDRDARRIWFGDGGQQMGAKWYAYPCIVNEHSRFFIENVFEELDAPGEWYLDRREGILYLYPRPGVDLGQALIEVSQLKRLIDLRGSQKDPVRHITFAGFRLAHTASTFLDEYEVPSLGDWAIHRGGAVTFEGTRDCAIADCWFDAVGGNAVFVNHYNRDASITGCTITHSGDSAICFVGSLGKTSGTQKAFPYECRAENNRITRCGVFGKQVAGVYISRAKRIAAGHNLIYNMPRAGICIGDGTWGGHVIEYNHIHDTCLETGDHGPFNAWGRDKGWCLAQSHAEYTHERSHEAHQMTVDAMEPVILRHNFFVEHAGWGLDLDDGATNYEIYNNICVGVSMKLREGSHRTVYNNIWVNGANSPCFHVGNEDNHDRYIRNITVTSAAPRKSQDDLNFKMDVSGGEIYTLVAPPVHGPWLEEIDYNCFYCDGGEFVARVRPRGKGRIERHRYTLDQWQAMGWDQHSIFGEPMFIDPANNDYRVQPDSPALKVGFENFDMNTWGLTDAFPQSWWS